MYIEQGFKGELGYWKYLPIPILFFGLMGLNYLVIEVMHVDVEALMASQIEAKGKNLFFFENIVPFALFLGALFFWVKYIHRQSLLSFTTARKKIDWKRFFFLFGLMGGFVILSIGIDYMNSPQNYELNFQLVPFLILMLIAVIFVPMQTSFEEYFFRGYLLQGLGVIFRNRWVPFILTSVLFGLMHAANPEVDKVGPIMMVFYIGTGLFLGIITLMDEGLELALGFHAANNLIGALLVTSNWTAFQTHSILIDVSDPNTGFSIILPVFVLYPILIFILAKKYKWSGWKEKLFGKVYPLENNENH
ncbi:CPBP family intramembrane glutamic endopeptidase [Aquimarina rhabdastrellae]